MFNQNPTGSATAVLAATAPNNSYTLYEANLLQGFYDPDGDTLNVASLSVENGEITDSGNGQWLFVPTQNFYGTITLNYLVSDAKGGDTQGALSFNITAPQTTPTGNVTISGTPQQNQTLTANTSALADVNGLGVFSYQWLSNGTVVSNQPSYALTQNDVGKNISVTASYTDGLGKLESVSSSSLIISNVNDFPTGSVSIQGEAKAGQILTAFNSLADLDGLGSISYQWLSNGAVISNQSSYTLTQNDVNKAISVKANYTDLQGTAESVVSPSISVAAPTNYPTTGNVAILGTVQQNQTLTVNTSALADVNGLGAFSYQWLSNGTVVSNQPSYALTQNDVGKNISVKASYTDGLNKLESVTSSSITVSNVNDLPTGVVSISGTPTKGQILTASNTLTDGDGLGKINYQWLSNENVISGATLSTYTLTTSDVGKTFTVKASYTDLQNTAESVVSSSVVISELVTQLNNKNPNFRGSASDADNVEGSTIADNIVGAIGNDTLKGNSGDDTIDGGNDSDQLFGNADDDSLIGGDGNDSLNGGDDNDVLDGGNGNDTLDGGSGADKMTGGNGDDVYFVENIGDTIVESTSPLGGKDTVNSNISLPQLDAIEIINLLGENDINAIGDNSSNTITGNIGNNKLLGNGGNDSLFGSEGNDTLDGGTGIDYLNGGQGDDTYVIDNSADVIEDAAGKDSVQSSETISLVSYPTVENLELTGNKAIKGTGNDNANIMTGNSSNNELKGDKGNDTLLGNEGDDTLNGGTGENVLDGGNDEDTVIYNGASSNYRLSIADSVSVTNILTGEIDQLIDVEFVKFNDETLPILNNEIQALSLSISDIQLKEGNKNGTVEATLVLTLDKEPTEAVEVEISTEDGTAISGKDYTALTQTITFEPNQKTQKVKIKINSDTVVEDNENFVVKLANQTDSVELKNTEATVTILNDDKSSLSISNVTIVEGAKGKANAEVVVKLSSPASTPVTVHYKTADGTAKSSTDYKVTEDNLTFEIGQTSKTILIPIVDDKLFESSEYFRVALSNPKDALLAAGKSSAKITITDNDTKLNTVESTSRYEVVTDDAFAIQLTGSSDLAAQNFIL